jgi:hypothetical protein
MYAVDIINEKKTIEMLWNNIKNLSIISTLKKWVADVHQWRKKSFYSIDAVVKPKIHFGFNANPS